MSVCGSVGGGGTSGSGMGYHGNILLKTNAGEGEAEMKGVTLWEGGEGGEPQTESLTSAILRNLPYDGE